MRKPSSMIDYKSLRELPIVNFLQKIIEALNRVSSACELMSPVILDYRILSYNTRSDWLRSHILDEVMQTSHKIR